MLRTIYYTRNDDEEIEIFHCNHCGSDFDATALDEKEFDACWEEERKEEKRIQLYTENLGKSPATKGNIQDFFNLHKNCPKPVAR
jgi:hypothetical protein